MASDMMTPSAGAGAGGVQHVDDEISMERNAGLIMGTNNSSIVSKRSVEKLYLPEPHFYRYFVRKLQRRSPTINRGYWLRMRAVDWTVRRFLETPSDQPKVVINLGCGYDPLPFHWLATERDLCSKTKFIDIDYEELMITKRNVIQSTRRLRDLLGDDIPGPFDKSILLNTSEYAAIGCDLRNIPRLQRLAKSISDLKNCAILCVAEVSITYMLTDAADALLEWASGLSPDVTFCLLEQGSPDRPDHPFTETMVKHFKKLGTPLHSLFEYPGPHTQSLRFQRAGFTHCHTCNLWELWGDPAFLSPSQRLALDQIEPFDEWEDFALFASHYLLVVADNRLGDDTSSKRSRSRRDSVTSIGSDLSARTASPFKPEHDWFAMRYYEDKSHDTKRHHASAYQVPGQDAIAIHGGVGPKARLANTAVCRPEHLKDDPPVTIPSEVGARCCHTITTFANGQNILIGGRGSPIQPMKDCWLQTGSQWTRIHDLPEPRYRHRTVPVTLPDGYSGAVVFGGKTGPSRVAATTLLWDPRSGWSVLESLDQNPAPRFGASFVYLGFNHGLLFGGMRVDGVICQGLWRWRLMIRENKVAGIRFRTSNALDASVGAYPWFARLGASCGLVRDELLIIGGVARSGTIPKVYEILSILGSFSTFGDHEHEMQLRLSCVEPKMPLDAPRPFYIGHSTHRTKTGTLIFMGGGATCFSFGNFYNHGMWIMHQREEGLNAEWALVETRNPDTANHPVTPRRYQPSICLATDSYSDVRSVDIDTSEDFLYHVRSSQPSVIRKLNLGPCLETWTPIYLRSKISPERSVVIHNAPARGMNFQRKDFAYKTLNFSNFISTLLSPTSHVYLRALSSTSPTSAPADFEKDWPELSPDVVIPAVLSSVLNEHKHSSCLRISNHVTMWLHYDVMANVLFQIHGIKKLILFPPSDLKYLSFPPGSTTSEIDIFPVSKMVGGEGTAEKTVSATATSIFIPEGTTPHVVILKPGDALFIPPLWAHSGISLRSDDKKAVEPALPVSAPLPAPAPANEEDPTTNPTSSDPGSERTILGDSDHNQNMDSIPDQNSKDDNSEQQQGPKATEPKTTNNHVNIALNIFFRSFPSQAYAHGRDVYGNRDLTAYEEGRRDIGKIVNKFLSMTSSSTTIGQTRKNKWARSSDLDPVASISKPPPSEEKEGGEEEPGEGQQRRSIQPTIPKEITKAYLERLADELRIKAAEL